MSPLNFPPSSPWRGAPSVPAQWPSCACPCLCTEELLTRQACVEDSMHLGSTCSTLRKGCPELISLWMSCRCLHRADVTPLGSTEHRAPVTCLHIPLYFLLDNCHLGRPELKTFCDWVGQQGPTPWWFWGHIITHSILQSVYWPLVLWGPLPTACEGPPPPCPLSCGASAAWMLLALYCVSCGLRFKVPSVTLVEK